MSVNFNGIGAVVATFLNTDAEVGDLVTISSGNTVSKAEGYDNLCGLVVSKNGDYVGVQVKGGMTVGYAGEPLSLGRQYITVGKNNTVQQDESPNAVAALIVGIDNRTDKVTMIL